MRYLPLLILLSLITSCKKEDTRIVTPVPRPVKYSEASYTMIVTLNWKNPQFSVPVNAHVTALIGMVHSKDTVLWNPGTLASKGLEDVAEVGNTTNMNKELDSIIGRNKAITKFRIPPPAITGMARMDFNVNTSFSCISFASMIAPSPDWFMGLHGLNLFRNYKWVDDITVNLYLYDAGTEDGNIFGYDNPATVPQQNISFLTPSNATVLAYGNREIYPIGTARFVKN